MTRRQAVVTCMAAVFLCAETAPVRVAPGVAEERLVYRVPPVYPALARRARIQGTVKFTAIIDEKGAVKDLTLISGHPFLVKAANDAVKQWRYRPISQNGRRAAFTTTIEVTFILPDVPRRGTVQV